MIAGIIPARYASTRFPGKPLIDIAGKSMIRRVYEQAAASASLSRVVVATDDQRIADHVQAFGGEAIMTAPEHPSGTDRCFEVVEKLGGQVDYVVNIQGDEPFIDPGQIDTLCAVLQQGSAELATLIIPVTDPETLFDMGEVKVVLNNTMEALYFSRMVIPFIKGVEQSQWHLHHAYFRHVGMYAYRTDVLKEITRLGVSSLEQAESLEQLRWLEAGYRIKCAVTAHDSHCVDTPEDVDKVLRLMGLG
ncbi:MAG: 3-deoxy-manno-octulosonate cytidylyltransferase [Sphingobacteriales bacterium]|nr:MAG: 3-deoxy-manno-octulosonate cytidylyltransferase [Sphingobacteriales bacterium]